MDKRFLRDWHWWIYGVASMWVVVATREILPPTLGGACLSGVAAGIVCVLAHVVEFIMELRVPEKRNGPDA